VWGAYGQSKLADLMFARQLAAVAGERGWALRSVAAHPGFTRTNLQNAGPNLGRTRPSLFSRGSNALPLWSVAEDLTGVALPAPTTR
jgi:NAD(P)-dependent dehydrogenase (short-subunit alcohol dehydrogenase family)